MNEEEWLAYERPGTIFDFLRDRVGETDRKLLLFSVACCRLKLGEASATFQERHRRAVETIERHADRLASARQMLQACAEIPSRVGPRSQLVLEVGRFGPGVGARLAARALAGGGNRCPQACELLRDILGNPFRPASLAPATWTPTIAAVARTIYEERTFGDLPVLADALEDAGCDDEAILAHCRGPGPHVRGCWVLDAILGKA